MNYLAHALFSLDDPYFTAGTAVPDWLAAADRRVRLRAYRVAAFREDGDPLVAAVAGGALQHLCDDALFHANGAFTELTWQLAVSIRRGPLRKIGPAPFSGAVNFLGHLLVEVLLDAALATEDPSRVERYYQTLAEIEPRRVEAAVNRLAARPTRRLAPFIRMFLAERILWDYLEDGKLMIRLNQVMRRVHLPPLPESFAGILPDARQKVAARKNGLLEVNNVNPWHSSLIPHPSSLLP